MSKITDALARAEAGRRASSAGEPARPLKQELWEEVRDLEKAFSRRTTPAASPPGPAKQDGNGVPAVPPPPPEPFEAWDQKLQRAQSQLMFYEQQATRKRAEQETLRAKLGVCEQLLVDVKQEQAELQERLETVADEAASVETERLSWKRQVDALRECQLLAGEVKVAEQELQTNAGMVAQILQAQQEIAQELARHQEHGQALQKRLDQLRFRLGQVLAFTGTIDPSSLESADPA